MEDKKARMAEVSSEELRELYTSVRLRDAAITDIAVGAAGANPSGATTEAPGPGTPWDRTPQPSHLPPQPQVQQVQQNPNRSSSQSVEAGGPRRDVELGFEGFARVIQGFARFGQLSCVAEFEAPHGSSSGVIASMDFNCSGTLFATAALSRRAGVFRFPSALLYDNDINEERPAFEEDEGRGSENLLSRGGGSSRPAPPSPRLEDAETDVQPELASSFTTRAKLSCVAWSRAAPALLGCSDYDGTVSLWDVATSQTLAEVQAHEQRAWCIDFSRSSPSQFVTGGDDGRVYLWSTGDPSSTPPWGTARPLATMDVNRSAVLSVSFSPGSDHLVAVSTADPFIRVFDLRRTALPVLTLHGHTRAVSYVRWLGPSRLVSASTDSTIRLWDLPAAALQPQEPPAALRTCARLFHDHVNNSKFVGLSVTDNYIACGSEKEHVHVYHRGISRTAAMHSFEEPITPEVVLDPHALVSPHDGGGWGGRGARMAHRAAKAAQMQANGVAARSAAALRPSGSSNSLAGAAGAAEAAGPTLSNLGGGRGGAVPVAASAGPSAGAVGAAGGPAAPSTRFITSVCWRPGTRSLLAANGAGVVRLLQLHE